MTGPGQNNTGMTLLPPAPSACQVCAREHAPEQPHDAQSLYWATARAMEGKPNPTWHEAMEHCMPDVRASWSEHLTLRGVDLHKPGGGGPTGDPR